MSATTLSEGFLVAGQLTREDLESLAADGVRHVLSLRPDDEDGDYATSAELADAAEALGLRFVAAPVRGLEVTPEALAAVEDALATEETAVAYCRSGRRVALAWGLVQAGRGASLRTILENASAAGHDLSELGDRIAADAPTRRRDGTVREHYDVVIVGGGSGGLATAASLRRRDAALRIAVIEPSTDHHYQPGLTLLGTGHFDPAAITRKEATLIPPGCEWVRASVAAFEPASRCVVLDDGARLGYRALVVAPGLELHWDGIEGAREALGSNGVCCNYDVEHAPYTWECIRALRKGTALFTQPAMPIKCAGAPQKALYLACDRWRDAGVLDDIDVAFHLAGPALFGVAHFVPVLTSYLEGRYGASAHPGSTLVAIDGPGRVARFSRAGEDGTSTETDVAFDFLHFVPPQRSPRFVRESPLADAGGWLAVDPETLRHPEHPEVFGVGDVVGTTNAKTMAAARKQAPIVAENLLAFLAGREPPMGYDGYGACPLTVEAGRVVLAEFGYGGTLLPTFPLAPEVPRYSQWVLKRHLMPHIYWSLMLRGREWFARPRPRAGADATVS
jgi:sulfide:quinone oxidoreductase